MAETTSSQPQNQSKPGTFNPFNPFNLPNPFDPSAFAGVTDLWTKAASEQQARVTALLEEMARVEEKSAAEARRAIEEMSRLSLATIDYTRELSANFRRMTLELTKRVSEAQPAVPAADKAKKN